MLEEMEGLEKEKERDNVFFFFFKKIGFMLLRVFF